MSSFFSILFVLVISMGILFAVHFVVENSEMSNEFDICYASHICLSRALYSFSPIYLFSAYSTLL